MPNPLSQEQLEEIIDHAKRVQGDKDYSKPYNVIAFCSERLVQIPFQADMAKDQENLDKIFDRLLFLNSIIGRIASLEGNTMEPLCLR